MTVVIILGQIDNFSDIIFLKRYKVQNVELFVTVYLFILISEVFFTVNLAARQKLAVDEIMKVKTLIHKMEIFTTNPLVY